MPNTSPPPSGSHPADPRTVAEEQRRILVESAKRKSLRGDGLRRQLPDGSGITTAFDVLALDAALERLGVASPRRAELVTLRYFAGLTVLEAAEALGVSPSTAQADWTFAKAWLKRELRES